MKMVSDFLFWASICGVWIGYFIFKFQYLKFKIKTDIEINALRLIVGALLVSHPELAVELKSNIQRKIMDAKTVKEVMAEMETLKRQHDEVS
jgi:hypothetical protein